MKTFNIIIPIQASYSYDIQANSLKEALEMIGAGEIEPSEDIDVNDVHMDEAIAYELTPQGYYPVQA